MRTNKLFYPKRLLDVQFSPNNSLTYVSTSEDKNSIHTANTADGTSCPLIIDDQSILDYGWFNMDTIWYVTQDRRFIYFVEGWQDESPHNSTRKQIVEDTKLVRDIAISNSQALALITQEKNPTSIVPGQGAVATVELYPDGPASEPSSHFFQKKPTKLVSWDQSSERLVAKTILNSFSHEIAIFDVKKDRCSQITNTDSDVRYSSIQWGPNNEKLYLVTDHNSDCLYIASLDLNHGEIEPVKKHPEWNIESVAIHPSGTVLYVVNKDGRSRVYTADLIDEKIRDPHLIDSVPNGVAKYAAIGNDGKRIAINVSTEMTPSIIYIYDRERFKTTSVVSTRNQSLENNIDDERISQTIRYESKDGIEISALYSSPQAVSDPDTIVIDIHGGPESQRRPEYRPRIRWLLDQDIAVLEPNIRGSLGYGREFASLAKKTGRFDAVTDVVQAANWVESQLDPDMILIYGQSYGGLISLINSYKNPNKFDAAISESGIYDLEEFIRSVEVQTRSIRMERYGNPWEHSQLFKELSPLQNADSIEIPILIIHGKRDNKVPYNIGHEFVDKVRKNGTYADAIFFDDGKHVIQRPDNVLKKLKIVKKFINNI